MAEHYTLADPHPTIAPAQDATATAVVLQSPTMNDTIFALSTAAGRAGIAVLRLSGPKALSGASGARRALRCHGAARTRGFAIGLGRGDG